MSTLLVTTLSWACHAIFRQVLASTALMTWWCWRTTWWWPPGPADSSSGTSGQSSRSIDDLLRFIHVYCLPHIIINFNFVSRIFSKKWCRYFFLFVCSLAIHLINIKLLAGRSSLCCSERIFIILSNFARLPDPVRIVGLGSRGGESAGDGGGGQNNVRFIRQIGDTIVCSCANSLRLIRFPMLMNKMD